MLANILSRYWWMTLLRGVLWVLFGICVLAQPGISLVTLTLLFGAFALADGIVKVGSAIGGRSEHEHWGVLLLAGLCGIGVGILTFMSPGITALVLLFYIAVWAIAIGLMELVVAKWESACRLARQLGPYVVIEAVMPGGSLMALALARGSAAARGLPPVWLAPQSTAHLWS